MGAKQDVDQKLSENLTAEFLSLMQEGIPFDGTFPSNANQAAVSRARRDMTDHFKSLNTQDQTTWISLIKKYRTGQLTEDELKTLNDLNPGFVRDLPMPVYTGETIRATMQGEFPTIDDILNSVLTQEQRDQKDQMIGRISEMLSDDQKRRIDNGEDIEHPSKDGSG